MSYFKAKVIKNFEDTNSYKLEEEKQNMKRCVQRIRGTMLVRNCFENDEILNTTEEFSIYNYYRRKHYGRNNRVLIDLQLFKINNNNFLYLVFTKYGKYKCNTNIFVAIEPIDYIGSITPDKSLKELENYVCDNFKLEKKVVSGFHFYNLVFGKKVIRLNVYKDAI